MKGYNIALWFCKTCGWSWQTLSSKFETEDQCPECNSYNTQRVIKQQDLV
jgi:rubrerythrin|tara:strand:+ start:5655 stop:5804 length:150 start_codon:yes stop_codon:yes gene_type:complete